MTSNQVKQAMFNTIQFPIKGTYYYAADLAFTSGWIQPKTQLLLKTEPDNPYDKNAIQIWYNHPTPPSSRLLIGYVPRALAKQLTPYLKSNHKQGNPLYAQVIHSAKAGKRIEIDCQIQLSFPWLKQLKMRWLCFWIRQQQLFTRFKNRFQPK